jgi:hypothetical protein
MSGEELCPSGRCAEGSVLLGIVNTDGTVAYLRPQMQVDAEFVNTAQRGRDPGKRFRFAEPCAEGGCGHWGDGRCTLIDRVLTGSNGPGHASDAGLPTCSIRPSCRWFAQRGRAACAVCPLVVRNPDPQTTQHPASDPNQGLKQ